MNEFTSSINVCSSWFSLIQKLWCQARVSEIFRYPEFECGIGKRPNSPTWVLLPWPPQVTLIGPSALTTSHQTFQAAAIQCSQIQCKSDWGWKCPLEEVSHPCFSQEWHSASVEGLLLIWVSVKWGLCRRCSWEPGNCLSQQDVVRLKFFKT